MGRKKGVGIPEGSRVRLYNLILAFSSHCLFHFLFALVGLFALWRYNEKFCQALGGCPALREKHSKGFQQTMFGSQAHFWTSEQCTLCRDGYGSSQGQRGKTHPCPSSVKAWAQTEGKKREGGEGEAKHTEDDKEKRKREGKPRGKCGSAQVLAEHLLVEEYPWAHDELEDVLQGFYGFIQLLIDSWLFSTGHVGP